MKHTCSIATLVALTSLVACGDSDKTDAEYQADVVDAMHDSIGKDLADLVKAAQDLQAAAPTTGWNATRDAAAITAMKEAWKRTRVAYEHVEGATAPIFPDLDGSMDARYDDYLLELGAAGDPDPFDGEGVTGMHGIERILYAPTIRQEVIDFEATLVGYAPAAFPSTDTQALAFKNQLAKRLVDDAIKLRDQWQPAAIDIGQAFVGLVGLMSEQKEKVNLAASGEEESRYANITLFDLRNNIDGTTQVYAVFRAWVQTKDGGEATDTAIQTRLEALSTLYRASSGESLPPVPDDWQADGPTPANLATPFGMLWARVQADVDPAKADSVVSEMNKVAVLLGFPQFVEEE